MLITCQGIRLPFQDIKVGVTNCFSFSETMIQFLPLPLAPRIQPLEIRYLPYICLSYITQSSFMGSSALYWISIHPPSSVQSEELLKRNPKACNVRNGMALNYQWYQQSVAYMYFVIIQLILGMASTHGSILVVLALYCLNTPLRRFSKYTWIIYIIMPVSL